MQLPERLPAILEWVESHGNTIDLFKWIAVGMLAWSLGLFRFLRAKLKRPRLEIVSFASRCIWQELGDIDGNQANARVAFLIEAGINNPTSDPLVVRDFALKVRRLRRWRVQNPSLHPTTLPARVRHSAGGVTKLLRNWFSTFDEGSHSLTVDSRVESRDFQSGFLLFVSASYGYMRPLVQGQSVPVMLCARLTTGETLKAKARISLLEDHSVLEAMVPGVLNHIEDPRTWNIRSET